jgi:outer membrane biosynthesis protein TonB
MRTGLTISAICHTALLLWSIITFTGKPFEAASTESMPIDIISANEFSQLTAGAKNAPKADTSKPFADQVGEKKPTDDPNAKLEKKEVTAAIDKPPPVPEPKPPSTAENKPTEEKRDLIAEAIKRDQVKKPDQKKAEAKNPAPVRKDKEQPKFDPRKVEALLDKRTPQRTAAVGDTIANDVSLGAANGSAAELSQSEIDALISRLQECWNPPVGFDKDSKVKVVIRVLFNPDGSVAKPPDLTSGTASSLGPAMAESAKRAILRCQPFKMLKPEHYEQWKDIEMTFDSQLMNRS